MPDAPVLVPPFDRLALWLPLYGPPLAIALALLPRGFARWIALAVGPFVVGWLMLWVEPAIQTSPGDWMARLGVMLLFLAGYIAITVHYGLLLLFAIRAWLRRNERMRQEAAAALTPARRPA